MTPRWSYPRPGQERRENTGASATNVRALGSLGRVEARHARSNAPESLELSGHRRGRGGVTGVRCHGTQNGSAAPMPVMSRSSSIRGRHCGRADTSASSGPAGGVTPQGRRSRNQEPCLSFWAIARGKPGRVERAGAVPYTAEQKPVGAAIGDGEVEASTDLSQVGQTARAPSPAVAAGQTGTPRLLQDGEVCMDVGLSGESSAQEREAMTCIASGARGDDMQAWERPCTAVGNNIVYRRLLRRRSNPVSPTRSIGLRDLQANTRGGRCHTAVRGLLSMDGSELRRNGDARGKAHVRHGRSLTQTWSGPHRVKAMGRGNGLRWKLRA
jgi:hypothetical protein